MSTAKTTKNGHHKTTTAKPAAKKGAESPHPSKPKHQHPKEGTEVAAAPSLGHAANYPDLAASADEAKVAATPLTFAETVSATEALARVKARALALPASEVIVVYRMVPAIANRNVRNAKAELRGFREQIPTMLPGIVIAYYDGIEDTALALVAAAAAADKVSSDGEFAAQLQLARNYRSKLLPALYSLCVNGHIPMKTYDDIAAGRGPRDTAQDCVDLSATFENYASVVVGKHPVSEADLKASAAVGTWLLQNLGTRGARALKPASNAIIDLRNRVATLLIRDYEDLSIIAHYFLRERYLDLVPPLGSRILGRRTPADTEPAPAPAPAPTPAPSAGSEPPAPVASPPAPPPAPAPAATAPAAPAAPTPGTPEGS